MQSNINIQRNCVSNLFRDGWRVLEGPFSSRNSEMSKCPAFAVNSFLLHFVARTRAKDEILDGSVQC